MIWHWIKNGPRDGCGFVEWWVGSLLWWRLWGVAWSVGVPFALAAMAYTSVSPAAGMYAGVLSAWIGRGVAIKISPKYNVTKNY